MSPCFIKEQFYRRLGKQNKTRENMNSNGKMGKFVALCSEAGWGNQRKEN